MAISKIDLDKAGVTGTLPTSNLDTVGVAQGGTGITSGTTDQFLKFTGTTTIASAADNAGTYVKLLGGSAGSSVTHNIVGFVDTSKYNNYFIYLSNMQGQQGNAIDFQFADGGGAFTASTYWYAGHGWRSSDNAVNLNGESTSQIELMAPNDGGANYPSCGWFYMTINPNSAVDGKTIQGMSWGYRVDVSDFQICNVAGWQNDTNTVTGFTLHATGNDATTFDYEVYGITK